MCDLSEADARYLDAIADDVRGILGNEVDLVSLEPDATSEGIVLLARYQLGEFTHASLGAGPSLLAAHAALRQQIVADRIGIGLAALTAGR
jgi:hypothetical protein